MDPGIVNLRFKTLTKGRWEICWSSFIPEKLLTWTVNVLCWTQVGDNRPEYGFDSEMRLVQNFSAQEMRKLQKLMADLDVEEVWTLG